MKYLLVIAVVLVAYWVWRHNRQQEARDQRDAQAAAQQRQRPTEAPAQMVTCRHCGVHLPQADACRGQFGYYCGKEHQRLAEG